MSNKRTPKWSAKTAFAVVVGAVLGWGATASLSTGTDGVPHPAHRCTWIQCADIMSTSDDCGGGWCVLGLGHQWYKCMPNNDYNCSESPTLYGAPITCHGTCLVGGGLCDHGPYNRCDFGGG